MARYTSNTEYGPNVTETSRLERLNTAHGCQSSQDLVCRIPTNGEVTGDFHGDSSCKSGYLIPGGPVWPKYFFTYQVTR